DPALASGEPIDPALLDPSLPAVPDGAPGTEAGTPGAALAGAAAGTAQTAAAATADEAIALVRQYHAELDRGAFDRAYLLWADDGRASGQSLDGFAAGLRETVDVQAEVGAPTRMRSGTAAQYVEVPVTVTLQYRDGRMRRLEGTYLLRRALAADAAENDRQWRINSVLLREAPSS
ncbi:MAG TPA: hypothetical protein VEY50_06545, partial [Lysobacter sp.]|nr:hypothetical protein [Lysobacter sp.]